jgi:hypothetical protein
MAPGCCRGRTASDIPAHGPKRSNQTLNFNARSSMGRTTDHPVVIDKCWSREMLKRWDVDGVFSHQSCEKNPTSLVCSLLPDRGSVNGCASDQAPRSVEAAESAKRTVMPPAGHPVKMGGCMESSVGLNFQWTGHTGWLGSRRGTRGREGRKLIRSVRTRDAGPGPAVSAVWVRPRRPGPGGRSGVAA